METLIVIPERRLFGVDDFAVSRTADRIMKAMEEAGWTIGEVQLLTRVLTKKAEENKKRLEDSQPFYVV